MSPFFSLRFTVLLAVLLASLASGMPVEERAATTTAPACVLAPRTTASSSKSATVTTRAVSPSRTTTSSVKPSTTTRTTATTSKSTTAPSPEVWQPKAGTPFQIVLKQPLKDYSPNVPIYIIDMYDNPISTIQKLHSLNRKVICYFSAGSYEDWRTDASKFQKTDYGKPLDPIWVGEWWLDTRSTNVRNIMVERLKLAKSKGCDGVDPDNVDGYANTSGFKMSQADGVDYMKFLSTEAHKLGLAIGLKNAPDIVKNVVDVLQWEVNEQCLEFDDECTKFKPFIDAGKPVFHIEYPQEQPPYRNATKTQKCNQTFTKGFSTLLKDMQLTDYYEVC